MAAKRKITIVGVGLLGGSLALALKKKGRFRLMGWNHRASSRKKASRLLPVAPTLTKAAENADVIILCSHSSTILPLLKELRPGLKTNALIMDVSSIKGLLVQESAKLRGIEKHFVPCHPMAGKEKSGAAYADASLYKGRFIFITPLSKNPRALVARAVRFWKDLGAIPVVMGAKSHDKNVALTSHVPHLLASAFVQLYGSREKVSPSIRKAVGSGFRDFTRIAGSNPAMWSDILEMNATEVRSYLSQYRRELVRLESKLKKGNKNFWLSFFEKGRATREKL
jgi:prephenate dehydrogenase